jgi:hypothetical protein
MKGLEAKFSSYQIILWSFNGSRWWTFIPIFTLDFCIFIAQFFYTEGLHLVNTAIMLQFIMNLILVVYFFVMNKWGDAKAINKRLEEMNVPGERENLVKKNTNMNV